MLLLLLLVLPSAHSQICSYIFDGQPYSRQAILSVENYPHYLRIEPTTNDLIYSEVDPKYRFTGRVLILRNGTPVPVDINQPYVAASDFERNRVFIGTAHGLKVLNIQNKTSSHIDSFPDIIITSIFKSIEGDKLYIRSYNGAEVYQLDVNTFENTKVELIPTAYDIAEDWDGNIFYVTFSQEYKVLLKGFKNPIQFLGLDNMKVGAFNIDDNNRVIAAVENGLYWLKPDSNIPKKLMDLDSTINGLAFDCDDIYIAILNTIYKYSKC